MVVRLLFVAFRISAWGSTSNQWLVGGNGDRFTAKAGSFREDAKKCSIFTETPHPRIRIS
jgi:hypothetical protein